MVASVWMLTTAGSVSCATTTTGVRRDGLTVAGIGLRCGAGVRSRVCDSATGLQARLRAKRTATMRTCFMTPRFYDLHCPETVRLRLIYNPTAGRGRARRHIAEA